MKLVIVQEVKKSKGKQGLVLRKVPVKLSSGKISFANRWVQPNKEQKKGKKISKQENNKEKNKTPSPFISTLPKTIDGVTPVAHESSTGGWEGADGHNYETELEALVGQYLGPDIIYNSKTDEWSIDGVKGTFKTETQAYREAHSHVNKNKGRELMLDPTQKFNELDKYLEDIGDVVEEFMFDHDTREDNINKWVDMEELAGEIMDYYGREITNSVSDMIPKNDNHSSKIQQRQFNAIFGSRYNPFSIIGSEPRILKITLQKMLGDEIYGALRGQVENSTLSINLSKDTLENKVIPEGSYKASSPERELLMKVGPEAVDKYLDIVKDIDDNDDWEVISGKLIDSYKDAEPVEREVARSIAERARYEKTHLEVRLKDPKPVYIAYNINNSYLGGQDYYGDSWMEISDEILSECTVGRTDSYYGGDTIASISNMDHLHDLSILKAICGEYPLSKEDVLSNKMDDSLGIPEWATNPYHEGDVALEIHYHKPTLDNRYVKKYHKDVF